MLSKNSKLVGLICGGAGLNVRAFAADYIAQGFIVLYVDGGAQIYTR